MRNWIKGSRTAALWLRAMLPAPPPPQLSFLQGNEAKLPSKADTSRLHRIELLGETRGSVLGCVSKGQHR